MIIELDITEEETVKIYEGIEDQDTLIGRVDVLLMNADFITQDEREQIVDILYDNI